MFSTLKWILLKSSSQPITEDFQAFRTGIKSEEFLDTKCRVQKWCFLHQVLDLIILRYPTRVLVEASGNEAIDRYAYQQMIPESTSHITLALLFHRIVVMWYCYNNFQCWLDGLIDLSPQCDDSLIPTQSDISILK